MSTARRGRGRAALLAAVALCVWLEAAREAAGQISKLRRQHLNSCLCNLRHRPVCTSDGQDYPNACSALCAHKFIACRSPCSKCKLVDNGNDSSVERGQSRRKTRTCICAPVDKAVCGEDGTTYDNRCFAKCKKVKVECNQECPCTDSSEESESNDDTSDTSEDQRDSEESDDESEEDRSNVISKSEEDAEEEEDEDKDEDEREEEEEKSAQDSEEDKDEEDESVEDLVGSYEYEDETGSLKLKRTRNLKKKAHLFYK